MTCLRRVAGLLICAATPTPTPLAAHAQAQALADAGSVGPAGAATANPVERAVDLEVLRSDAGLTAALDGGARAIEPPQLLADSPAAYPDALSEQRASAEIALQLLVDEAGRVTEVAIERGGEPLFEQAAVEAARRLSFAPARMDGTPIAVRISFSYRFEPPPPLGRAALPAAPQATLRGLVREKGLRAPLAGASVDCFEAAVETGADGRFELALSAGLSPCRVSAPGHRPFTFLEQLKPGEALEVLYGLEPLRINPYETVVRAERDRAEVARFTLRGQELREVPGTMGDPFRVVMLLPGVSSIVSGVAYPVVRGTAPAATGYFLDGVRVPLLYHLVLGPAVVHPDFIESVDFYPGAPPPQYGRLLGGALDGKIRRPRDDRWHGTVYADLINAGGLVEYPLASTGTSFTVAGRLSYTPLLIALLSNSLMPSEPGRTNPKVVLDFWDYQARVEQGLWGGRLRLFAFGSNDKVGTESDDATLSTELESVLFHRIDLRYRRPAAGGELEAGVTWGFDRLASESSQARSVQSVRRVLGVDETSWRARARWDGSLSERLSLSVGGDVDHRANALSSTEWVAGIPIDFAQPVAAGTFFGLWSQVAWESADKRTRLVPGLRLDAYHRTPGLTRFSAEPRLSAQRALGEHFRLKAGAGLFHQQPTTLIQLPVIDVAGLQYGLQEGAQFDLGIEWKGARGLEASLEVYFDPLFRTLELDPFQAAASRLSSSVCPGDSVSPVAMATVDPGSQLPPNFDSHGYAYGLELLLRHPLGGNWFGWISYTLQRSVRRMQFCRYDAFGAEIGPSSADLPYAYDQTHVFNAVVSYKLASNWTFGVVLHVNTGRPEAGGMTSTTMRPGVDRAGTPTWVRVSRDQVDRLPPFWRVDVRIAKSWVSDTYNLDLYLDVLNASLQREVLGYTYREDGSPFALKKEPTSLPLVLPTLGLKATY